MISELLFLCQKLQKTAISPVLGSKKAPATATAEALLASFHPYPKIIKIPENTQFSGISV